MNRTLVVSASLGLLLCGGAAVLLGQRSDDPIWTKHPAIQYATRAATDPVAELNQRIRDDQAHLAFDATGGYLRSVLDALHVPVESQMLVYSETSLQHEHIALATPRALYFNDSVAVGWVNGAEAVEVAAHDPQQGVIFYVLSQMRAQKPHFVRSSQCLQCHETPTTAGVPGLLTMSMLPLSDDPNEYAVGWAVDQRTPIEDRWGGWYVTGAMVPKKHLGNVPVYHVRTSGVRAAVAPQLPSVAGAINVAPYLTPYSDVAAILIFNHQTYMTNLLTRLNWVTRVAEYDTRVPAAPDSRGAVVKKVDADGVASLAAELVDYMLFIDEVPLTGRVKGGSGFTERFAATGPRDSKGRSLRELDLEKRLLRYPCSYMIYSAAFEALPIQAKSAVYARLWHVLSGQDPDRAYARLSPADRQAIVEILRETKNDLPASFRAVR